MATQVEFTDEVVWEFWPGGQNGFAQDWAHRFVALEGGWGGGKSFGGSRKLVKLHTYNAFDDTGAATFVPSAVIAPTYSNAMDYDVPALEAAFDEIGLSYQWKGNSSTLGQSQYAGPGFVFPDLGTRKNPSAIIIRTADAPNRITGWEVGAAWGDEAARWKADYHDPRLDPYIQLTGRVRHPRARCQQLFFTYTNEGDKTRVFDEFHKGHPTHALYRVKTSDNPLMKEWSDGQRLLLTPEMAEQYLDGGAMNLRGRSLYSRFDEGQHVVDGLQFTYDLPLQMSLDFNINPGMHAELGHYDYVNDVFYSVREIFENRLDVIGVIDIFTRMIEDMGGWQWEEPLQIYGDATGGTQHWSGTGETCYQILAQGLEDAGIPFRIRVGKTNPFVQDRVNAANMALKDLSGSIHWKMDRSCERLLEDMHAMRYDEYGCCDKSDDKISHASEAEGYRIYRLRPIRKRKKRTGGRTSVQT